MNIKLVGLFYLVLIYASANAQEIKIEANKAAFHVGKTVMACGQLMETKHLTNRHYLNLDNKYPNQSLTLLVWDKDYKWFENRFGEIDSMVGSRFCARGKIEEYKNNLQIQVSNPQFLRLTK